MLTTAVGAGCVLAWEWWGWDRSSVAGASSFAHSTFAWVVAAQAVLAMGFVPALVAPGIASERDGKSLDSLLATRLSALEIVLGTIGAGLLRYVNGLAALAPIVTLMVFLGGIEPRLVLLAVAGIASTALALASLSAAISAGARTASLALSLTVSLSLTWMCLPAFLVIIIPRVWTSAVPWVVPIAVRLVDSSPGGADRA
ncbi:MAG: hypothetical protein NVSMB9_32640 [Isosphaeraceae bacterium]